MEVKGNNYQPKEIIKFIRQNGNIKQKDLAVKLNKSLGWIKNIEQGRNKFYYEDLLKICELCNVEIIFKEKK